MLCVLRRSTPPRVESLVGGEAAEQGGRVCAGMALTAIGSRGTAGMAYGEVLALMRSAPRPLRLTFKEQADKGAAADGTDEPAALEPAPTSAQCVTGSG